MKPIKNCRRSLCLIRKEKLNRLNSMVSIDLQNTIKFMSREEFDNFQKSLHDFVILYRAKGVKA